MRLLGSILTRRLSVDVDPQQVSNISNIGLIIKCVMMRSLHGNQQLSDGLSSQLAGLAFRECQHRALHEIELLLEVIKANACVYLIPVEYLGLVRQFGVGSIWHALKAAVDVLIVQNVEQLLEKEPIAKVHCEVFNFPATSHREYSVQQNTQVVRLLQNGPSPILITGLLFDGEFATADVHDVLRLADFSIGVLLLILLIYLLILFLLHLLSHLLVVLIVLSLLSVVITIFHVSELSYLFSSFKYI